MNTKKSKQKTAHKKAVLFDKLAEWTINTGGFAVIIAVFGILLFIMIEGLPLLFGAKSENSVELKPPVSEVIYTGIEEYQNYLYVITRNHQIEIVDKEKNKPVETFNLDEIQNYNIHSIASDLFSKNFVLGLDSGMVATFSINFNVTFDANDQRISTPEVNFGEMIQIDTSNLPISNISYTVDEDQNPTIVGFNGVELVYYSSEVESSLFGDGEKQIYISNLSNLLDNQVEDFVISNDGKELVVANIKKELNYISLMDKETPQIIGSVSAPNDKSNISALAFLTGNQSVVVGDDKGNIYSVVKNLDEESETGWEIQISHTFERMHGAITYISPSSRNKGFLVGSSNGDINLYYLTSERTLLSQKGNGIPVEEVNFAPKADGLVALYSDRVIFSSRIDNPHPEVSIKSLFGKILYEGYKDPEYVWQSTGGSDSFEPKFSLIPLIFGTLKGTLYAMLFAIPLALLGALYTSTFSHPKLKNKIKPTVEILAALPSVVIGFLAGLWLAPLLERIFPGAVLMFILLPILIVIGVLAWSNIELMRKIVPRGYEIFLIVPILILGGWLSIELSPWFEKVAFSGDYRIWISEYLNSNYDQRNSIVVGFALGFAVIPIIFTIAEDALSSVPQHLTSASLALGATKWQTAIRVVLPTASPGIFSAIMIGFGRAIGETMIVLMATGNTPILDWGPFNGMRTLAANIAVEIPEAPYHGTLYRILFVSAALLFVLTFIVNTVAELVRQRLRKKYMHI